MSVVQPGRAGHVDYYHVELDSHDVIKAEGAWSETFVDDDCRGMFQNAPEFAALYPKGLASGAVYCAPRIDQGFVVEAVRRRLALRAGPVAPSMAA